MAHSLVLRAGSPYEVVRTVLSAARGPRRVTRKAIDTTRGVVNLRSLLDPNPTSSLNGPIGPHRRWDWARARLSDIRQIREVHGVTINDAVLAAITNGFRELLSSRGESVERRVIRTLVPVSVRAEDEHGTYNNKVSAMFAELPVEFEDPTERLEALHQQMQYLKHSGQAVAAERLTALTGFAPAMLLTLAGRVGTPVAPEQRQHGHDQRPRTPASALSVGSAPARGVSVRAPRGSRAGGSGDLLLRRQGSTSA